jgi:two-component system KDP operon response regulator KdpE
MSAPPAVPGSLSPRDDDDTTPPPHRECARTYGARVEDEAPIRQLLRRVLESHGYAVVEAADAATGIAQCAEGNPDLVILDLGLPDRDGRELIADVRIWSRVPILVVSGRTAASEKVAALDLGGSDYVVKPFSMPELLARVRALLRDRPRARDDAPVHRVGPVELDIARHRVTVAGAPIRVSRKEFELLRVLMMHVGRVVPHKQLLSEIWGACTRTTCSICASTSHSCARSSATIRASPRFIANEQGVGYRFIEVGLS